MNGAQALFQHPRAAAGAVIGLGLLGTGLAYVLYYHIIAHLGALVASSATYIPPVVALVIGLLWADESIDVAGCLAIALILAGVAVLQWAGTRSSRWAAQGQTAARAAHAASSEAASHADEKGRGSGAASEMLVASCRCADAK